MFRIKEDELINQITFYCYSVLSSGLYLELFEAKLHTVAGNWPRIPITTNKNLFLSLSNLGEQLAYIESSDYIVDINETDVKELKYHKYKITINSICFMDANGQFIREIKNVDEQVLTYEVSGYNIVREWLKLHSYPYYRKGLEENEIKDLFALFRKISLSIEKITAIDESIGVIMKNKLIYPYD